MKRPANSRRRLAALCAGLALAAGPAGAFDLMDAYRLALTADPNFQAARATAEAARELLPQARAELLPQISISANRSKNDTEQTSKAYNLTREYEYTGKNDALSLRQPLFRLGSVARYYQASAQVDAAEATLEKDTQQLALRVSDAYFGALVAREKLDSILAQKDAYAGQLAAAERSLAAGFGTRTDIDDARARLDMAGAQEIEARHALGVAERTLAGIVNQRVKTETLARIDAGRLRLDNPNPAGLDAWLAQAEELNPELRAMRSNVEAAEREVDKGRAAHLPTLDLVASRRHSDSDSDTSIGTMYRTTSIGVQLNIPIYSGGYTNSALRQAHANLEKTRQQYEAGKRQLEVMVAKEFAGVEQGVARVRALEQALRSAEQALHSTRKGVQAGTRNNVDVLNALQQLANTRYELASARANYSSGRLKLKAAAGTLAEQDVAEINAWLGADTTQPIPASTAAKAEKSALISR
jgi:outer membrane protein/protease secretion system outer membrane protein